MITANQLRRAIIDTCLDKLDPYDLDAVDGVCERLNNPDDTTQPWYQICESLVPLCSSRSYSLGELALRVDEEKDRLFCLLRLHEFRTKCLADFNVRIEGPNGQGRYRVESGS